MVDLKGAYADGRRYRFVGVVFESFEYDEVSAQEAAFFDRILDTICYAESLETPVQVSR